MAQGIPAETHGEISGIGNTQSSEAQIQNEEAAKMVLSENGNEEPSARTDGEPKDAQVAMPMTIDVSRSRSPAVRAPENSEPVSPTPSDGLRRASSKIANLRAAFERQHSSSSLPISPGIPKSPVLTPVSKSPDASKRRFDRSPASGREQDGEVVKMREEHEAQIARLKDRLDREAELRQAFEDKCTALEEETEELQTRLSEKDGHWRREVSREKERASGELTSIRSQLVDLKKSIAAATRQQSQTADSTFAQEMQHLYHEIQNWVVNNFRRVKLDQTPQEMCARLEAVAEPKQLEHLKPVFENFDPALKLSALQAVTAYYLMEIFEEPLLFGMPVDEPWRRNIKAAAETLPTILTPPALNRWRAVTLDAIKQSTKIKQSVDSASQSMSEMICITLNTLTEAEESSSKISSLNAIVKRTISLAHLFRIQRAQYDFSLPPPGAVFSPDAMEDHSLEGEVPVENQIRCATFPAVTKRGDENGDNVQLSNVVIKAKVLCKS